MLNSTTKHILHTLLLLVPMTYTIVNAPSIIALAGTDIDPWVKYGTTLTIFLYTLRLMSWFMMVISLPENILQILGLIVYNAFPDKVVLKNKSLLEPFICIRVVTRGDFPDLVNTNVMRNMKTCLDTGIENFVIEVVTDKPVNIPKHRRIREIVVPQEYKSKSGAMFKARALQYCLEDSVNKLNPTDWIVHLDEETIVTENSVRGISNFVSDGKFAFGQGLITYANESVVNWMTTLADTQRVSDDMGKNRFQLKTFHKPLYSWKGSFVVTQVSGNLHCFNHYFLAIFHSQFHAEKDVSFDNGPDGSIAEDCFFAMKAYHKGYSFDWIEGEMYEKSPFTVLDFMKQRKRWLQGIYLVVNSKDIPLRYKFFVSISHYVLCLIPVVALNTICIMLFPFPSPIVIDLLSALLGYFSLYSHIFGVIKSFPLKRLGFVKSMLCFAGVLCIAPVNLVIQTVVVVWGLLTNKHTFYVLQKTNPSSSHYYP